MTRTFKTLCLVLCGCAALGISCKKKPPTPPPPARNAPAPSATTAPAAKPIAKAPRATAPGKQPAAKPRRASPSAKSASPTPKIHATPLGPKALARLSKLRLPNCPEQRLLKGQSFALRAPKTPHNEDLLAAFTCGSAAKVRFVQIDGKRIRRTLSDHPANAWAVSSVDAVAFRDVNGDHLPDFIALVSAMTGIGPTGARPFRVAGFWLGTADGPWRRDAKASARLTRLRKITVRSVTRFLRRHYRK